MSNFVSIPTWWKVLVVIASFLVHVIIWGFAFGAGVFQVVFIHEFSRSLISQISLICSLIPTFTCLAGPISSILTNKYGCRFVGCLGSLIAALALLSARFAYDVWFLLVAFSFLGVGLGIAYIPCVVIICKYFEERRPLAVALAGTGLGVGTTIMPPVIQYLVDHWHWRNAAVILSGVVLNIGVLSTLFVEPGDKIPEKRIILHINVFKRPAFILLWINNFLVLFGLLAFYIHLPTHLETAGWANDDFSAALLVSVVGIGTVLGRLIVGFILQCLTYPVAVYSLTIGMGGLIMISVPLVHNFWLLFTVLLLFGAATSTLGPLLPLIITDMLGVDLLSSGYGYILVAEALGSLSGPPFAGYLYDTFHDYTYSVSISGLTLIGASIIVAIPSICNFIKCKEEQSSSTDEEQTVAFIKA